MSGHLGVIMYFRSLLKETNFHQEWEYPAEEQNSYEEKHIQKTPAVLLLDMCINRRRSYK